MARTIPNRLKGIPYLDSGYGRITGGRIFWVGSASSGSDGNSGFGPDEPLATIDYAVGLCTASRGDVIRVMEGHAETISTATGLIADIAGVKIIGMGTGALRPTITFATATTALLSITAANIEIANLIFVCNVASQARMIALAAGADGAYIHHNTFREGSASGLSMVEWTGAADDVRIEDNEFYAPTAATYDEAILIASTPTRGKIRRNYIFGDWDEGGINNAVGNIATLFDISDNQVINLLTNTPAINLDSAVTGTMFNNYLGTDTNTTALDPGNTFNLRNLWNSINDVEGGPALPPSDISTNFIGADDADN